MPHELSGGQRQRVAIGRAVLAKPAIIFADEPTGNLGSETGIEVLKLFRKLVDDMGQTLLMITHDEHAAQFGDNLIRMKDGRIIP
nr:ATP-binding cassette domain-containing protein [Corynebacterium mycetoides]